MNEEMSRALEGMVMAYESHGILRTEHVMVHFATWNPRQCLEWTLQMVEDQMVDFLAEEEIKANVSLIRNCVSAPAASQLVEILQMTRSCWYHRNKIWVGPKPYLVLARLGWACQGFILTEHYPRLVEQEVLKNRDFQHLKKLSEEERQHELVRQVGLCCSHALDVAYDDEVMPNGHRVIAQSLEEVFGRKG
ncbi:MAG: hypothetical protein AAFR61_05755 [Bacteroidota bacterium]